MLKNELLTGKLNINLVSQNSELQHGYFPVPSSSLSNSSPKHCQYFHIENQTLGNQVAQSISHDKKK